MQGPSECGQSLFLRVAAAFIQSRRDPKNSNISEVTILVGKLTERTPCTYIGGLILFFGILTGLTVYEGMEFLEVCEETGVEKMSSSFRVSDMYHCDATDSRGAVMHGGLAREIGAAVASLECLSTRHTVLLYLAQAARYRVSRATGAVGEGAKAYHSGITSISQSHPAHALPLGVAYLKMELALSLSSISESAIALQLAEESLEIFFLFEAQKEIAILDDCISSLNGSR